MSEQEPLVFTAEEYRERAERMKRHLAAQGMKSALLIHLADRFYFSGTVQLGYVYLPVDGEPLLIVRKDVERAERESPLPVEPMESVRDLKRIIEEKCGKVAEPLGLTMDVLPMQQAQRITSLLPGVAVADCTRAVMLTRAVKSDAEIGAIRSAAHGVAEAVARVPTILYPGMREIELAAGVEYELRTRGHGGFTPMRGYNQRLFYGHVFAGAQAAEPSGYDAPTAGLGLSPSVAQGASEHAVEAGEPVVVDLVGHYGGYLCDQTRMFSLGKVREPFEAVFEAAAEIQRAVAEAARPGVLASALYDLAVKMAAKTPYGDHFLGDRDKVSFVGHGIGLEVDEYPFLARGFDMPLEEGMVFALEPKFLFRGSGAVGIEDTYVVRAEGVERLTLSPQKWTVIEGG